VHFVAEAYRHAKPIVALGAGRALLDRAGLPAPDGPADGVLVDDDGVDLAAELLTALAGHRTFSRRQMSAVPA
jgi:catalase